MIMMTLAPRTAGISRPRRSKKLEMIQASKSLYVYLNRVESISGESFGIWGDVGFWSTGGLDDWRLFPADTRTCQMKPWLASECAGWLAIPDRWRSIWFELEGDQTCSTVTAEKALELEIEREERGDDRGIARRPKRADRSTSCRQPWHTALRGARAPAHGYGYIGRRNGDLSSSEQFGSKVG